MIGLNNSDMSHLKYNNSDVTANFALKKGKKNPAAWFPLQDLPGKTSEAKSSLKVLITAIITLMGFIYFDFNVK